MRRILLLVAVCGAFASTVPAPAPAQDASFGCKVLLCAAASAPGWPSIPYCVPVMETLFRLMARGHPWPTCSEGHAGRLGHEPFMPCPADTVAVTVMADGTIRRDSRGDRCAKPSSITACGIGGGRTGCASNRLTLPRERRAEPDFVDIATANGAQRLYFDLRRYR